MRPGDRPQRRVVIVSRNPEDRGGPHGGGEYGGTRYGGTTYGSDPYGGGGYPRIIPGYEGGPWGGNEMVVTRGRFHFSEYEIDELKKAFALILLIFTIAMSDWRGPMADGQYEQMAKILAIGALASFLALLTGFVGHEIAHKLVAQKYGYWAEFRSNQNGMMWGLMLALFIGLVFVAPGAVMIRGAVTKRENGHISAAGPLSNMAWVFVAMPFYFFTNGWSDEPILSAQFLIYQAFWFMLWINIALGAFNMIPFYPLDGSKIWDWSKPTYLGMVALIVILVITGINLG